MSNGSVLQVVILRNGNLVGTEMLVPGDYRIGRDTSCDIHIDEPTLSRVHARLVFNGTRVGIQDLESDNGVVINGERIKAREVKSLDDVALGKVTLKLKVIGRKEEAAAAPAQKGVQQSTVVMAARPSSNSLRAALEPVPRTPPPGIAQPRTPAPRTPAPRPPSGGIPLGGPDAEVTNPAPPPSMAVGAVLTATQPSARRAQVAPEIREEPAPVPPRPIIGLVPPPAPAARVAPPPAPELTPAPSARPGAPHKQPRPQHAAPLNATVPRQARADLLAGSRPTGHEVPKPGVAAEPQPESVPAGVNPSVRARVFWGDQMVACRTFEWGEKIIAAERETASLPVYEFGLGKKSKTLCRVHASSWAVQVPDGVKAELNKGQGWTAMPAPLSGDGDGIFPLDPGSAVRLKRGRMAIEFMALAPQPALPKKKYKPELSVLIPFVAALAAVVAMKVFMPKSFDTPDFVPRQLPQLRAALVPPPPKPKEEKKKEPEKVAEKRNEEPTKKPTTPKKVVQVVKRAPAAPQPVQAPAAVAALQKLTASPAMSALLNSTGKLTGGRPNGLKMTGLKGIGPVALGPGGGGLPTGASFASGPVTGGREQLAGIGAIGVGHALKGSPGGTVVQAPARQAQVHGSMSREEIAKVINAHMQEIRGCYERALLHEPGLAGKLMIQWTIDTSGGVTEFKVMSSSMKNPDVATCILGNIRNWRFPRPSGGTVVVNYPFVFNSVGF